MILCVHPCAAGYCPGWISVWHQVCSCMRPCACASVLTLLSASHCMQLQALIKGPISSLDLPAATRLLLACLPQHSSSSSDSSPRSSKQQALAMEAFALATDSVGAQLPNLLKQAGSSDLNVTQVLTQVQQLQRPVLAADGSLQHNSSVQAAIAAVEAAATTHSGSSLLIGAAGMYDRNSNISTSSFRSDSSMGGRPLSASSQASGQQQQMLPPGSLGALAAHAQLISSAASSIAAAAATSRGGGSAADTSVDATGRLSSSGGAGSSSRPASSLMADPSCHGSPLPDGRWVAAQCTDVLSCVMAVCQQQCSPGQPNQQGSLAFVTALQGENVCAFNSNPHLLRAHAWAPDAAAGPTYNL